MMKRIQSRSLPYLRSSSWGSTFSVNRVQNFSLPIDTTSPNDIHSERLRVLHSSAIYTQHYNYLRWLTDSSNNQNHLVKTGKTKQKKHDYFNSFTENLVPYSIIACILSLQMASTFAEENEESSEKLRITNLVFKGGGPKGLAYIGALEALEEHLGLGLPGVKRVAGASAGAITAALVAVGYSSTEIDRLISPELLFSFITDDLNDNQKLLVIGFLDLFELYHQEGKSNNHMAKQFLKDNLKRISLHPIISLKAIFHGYKINREANNNAIKPNDIKTLFHTLSPLLISILQDKGYLKDINKPDQVKQITEDLNNIINRFFEERGLSSGKKFRNWINELIRDKIVEVELAKNDQCISGNNCVATRVQLQDKFSNVTYGQLNELISREVESSLDKRHYRHLYLVEVHREHNQPGFRSESVKTSEIMDRETDDKTQYSPNTVIADSVRGSMSIPFVFTDASNIFHHNGDLIAESTSGQDGGILENYPFKLFDSEKYLAHPNPSHSPHYEVLNHETIGFVLFDRHNLTVGEWFNENLNLIKNLNKYNDAIPPEEKTHFINRYLKSFGIDDSKDIPRHVKIDNCGVTLVSFKLDKDKITELKKSGKTSMLSYLNNQYSRLLTLQQKADKESIIEFNKLFESYSKLSNTQKFTPVPYYVKTSYDKQLWHSLKKSETGQNLKVITVTGVAGTGKSNLVYHNANLYLREQYWASWRKEELNTYPNAHVWIFDASSPETLLNSFRALPAQLGGDPELQKLTEGYLLGVHDQLSKYPGFLWIFDNIGTVDNLSKMVDSNKITFSHCIPNINGKYGRIWLTTEDTIVSLAGLQIDKIDMNKGFSVDESKFLIKRIMPKEYEKYYADCDRFVMALECIPHSIVVACEYLVDRNSTINIVLTQFSQSKKHMANDISRILSNSKYKQGSVLATVLRIGSLTREDDQEILRLLLFCSKLNCNAIPESLLIDYMRELHPQLDDRELIKSKLRIAINRCGSLLFATTRSNLDIDYRMHNITQSVLNNEWQLPHDFFTSASYIAIEKETNISATRILSLYFTERNLINSDVFKKNTALLPHIDTLLSHNSFEKNLDRELRNQLIDLSIIRCFMYLSMGHTKPIVEDEALKICKLLNRHARISNSDTDITNQYKKLKLEHKQLPNFYARLLYILGRTKVHNARMNTEALNDKGTTEDPFQLCIKLCELIAKDNGHYLQYHYLSRRSQLSKKVQNIKKLGLVELHSLRADYDKLLEDNRGYYINENEKIQFDNDKFNLSVCYRYIASIDLRLLDLEQLPLTGIEKILNEDTANLERLVQPSSSTNERFEFEAEIYNSLGMIYQHPKNPKRDLNKAWELYKQGYEIEMKKYAGAGKRDYPLADAAYGLADVYFQLGRYSQAKICAENCRSIRKEINSNKLPEVEALLIQIQLGLDGKLTPKAADIVNLGLFSNYDACPCKVSNHGDQNISENVAQNKM